jgi:hypothetical protein
MASEQEKHDRVSEQMRQQSEHKKLEGEKERLLVIR